MMSFPRAAVAFTAVALVIAGCAGRDGSDAARTNNAARTNDAAPANHAAPIGGVERTYFIAADQVVWDYAPDGVNKITGKPFGEQESVFAVSGPGRLGPRYQKCLYRGYADDTFTTLQQRPAEDAYLGFLGPVIRAEVGDTVKVVFRNNCSFPASVHPHGVFYDKASEGAPYADGTRDGDKADDAVPPHGTHTYVWQVPERAGPGPMEGSSAVWMYHSHTDEIADVYAGLAGFLVVTAAGRAKPDGSPADVDREVFSLFEVVDENSSPLLDANIKRFGSGHVPAADGESVPEDDDEFVESNLKHAINGYLYGNGPMVTLHRGERVRWYLMGMGTEVDLHTPHWHANTAVVAGMRTDVVNLLPASMAVADMTPDDAGTWLFHCHVGDHIAAGMQALYQVTG